MIAGGYFIGQIIDELTAVYLTRVCSFPDMRANYGC